MTLINAINAARHNGYIYLSGEGNNADSVLWDAEMYIDQTDDSDDRKTYEYLPNQEIIEEYNSDGNPTGWYLQLYKDAPETNNNDQVIR